MKPTQAAPRKALVNLLRENAGHAALWSVWTDFLEMSAIAISNAMDIWQREEREARYMQIVGRYNGEQINRFAQALGSLVAELETVQFADVLGSIFMELELSSKWAGQFFTPFELCRAMARMQIGDGLEERLKTRGFVTASDPAVGAGALPIALAEAIHEAGHNYQQCLHVTAQDVDVRAAHMAYIQLSLLHVPAVVIVGNTLSVECREQWFTPAHILGAWSLRLRSGSADSSSHAVAAVPEARQLDQIPVGATADLFAEPATEEA